MKKRQGLLWLTIGVLFFAVACSGEKAEKGRQGPRLFGATYMTRNNPYFEILNESIDEVVEANGDILIVRDPQQDQERQNQQIHDMIEEGIEMLFLNPVDWNGVEPALKECRQAGVPIINLDTVVQHTDEVLAVIETDNYQAGMECAKDMIKRVDHAEIVILNNPIQTSISDRVRGFKDTIKKEEGYKIVYEMTAEGEIEVAAEVMSDFLKKDISFNVVFGGNDPTALGALAALQQYKMEEGILLYGIDGSPDFKAMIALGHVTGTSSQSPKDIGQVAAQTAYRHLEGLPVLKHMKLPSTIITKENLEKYGTNGWQ